MSGQQAEREGHMPCLECGKIIVVETDLWLCQNCMDKFDVDKIWKLHDKGEIDALDFNGSEKFRNRFRK